MAGKLRRRKGEGPPGCAPTGAAPADGPKCGAEASGARHTPQSGNAWLPGNAITDRGPEGLPKPLSQPGKRAGHQAPARAQHALPGNLDLAAAVGAPVERVVRPRPHGMERVACYTSAEVIIARPAMPIAQTTVRKWAMPA